MNKWNQLLATLDQVFGMKNKERSTFKKISQDFDEKTNEHVIVIEYRVRVKGTVKSTPRKNSGRRQLAFLRQLMATQAKIR
jgi:hypothetical protein